MAFLRARDVEDIMRYKGQERGTVHMLATLAEQQIALQKDMRMLADSVNMMADIVQQFGVISENMKNTMESLNSDLQNEDDLGSSTQLIGKD